MSGWDHEAQREIDTLQEDLDSACQERDELVEMLVALQKALRVEGQGTDTPAIQCVIANVQALAGSVNDLNVQCKFWRQAAEHAVNGWNNLEDRIDGTIEALEALVGNAQAAREMLGRIDDAPPPDTVKAVDDALNPYESYEVGGVTLRVVEEESPLECTRCTCGVKFRTAEDYRDHLPCRVQG